MQLIISDQPEHTTGQGLHGTPLNFSGLWSCEWAGQQPVCSVQVRLWWFTAETGNTEWKTTLTCACVQVSAVGHAACLYVKESNQQPSCRRISHLCLTFWICAFVHYVHWGKLSCHNVIIFKKPLFRDPLTFFMTLWFWFCYSESSLIGLIFGISVRAGSRLFTFRLKPHPLLCHWSGLQVITWQSKLRHKLSTSSLCPHKDFSNLCFVCSSWTLPAGINKVPSNLFLSVVVKPQMKSWGSCCWWYLPSVGQRVSSLTYQSLDLILIIHIRVMLFTYKPQFHTLLIKPLHFR